MPSESIPSPHPSPHVLPSPTKSLRDDRPETIRNTINPKAQNLQRYNFILARPIHHPIQPYNLSPFHSAHPMPLSLVHPLTLKHPFQHPFTPGQYHVKCSGSATMCSEEAVRRTTPKGGKRRGERGVKGGAQASLRPV